MGITKEEKEKLAAKHMQSNRHTNPLMPDYKLASGPSIMPSAPEWVRVTLCRGTGHQTCKPGAKDKLRELACQISIRAASFLNPSEAY